MKALQLEDYRRIVFLTGAGISAASGLPTYRGAGGLWTTHNVAEYATAEAVRADPRRVWEFFASVERSAKRALRDCDLFIAVGTSGTVSPASNFVRAARFEGARTVYVNLEPMVPANPEFAEVVLGPAEVVLPELLG